MVFSDTKLLLHCNGIDASTTFPDVSFSSHAVTAHGNAQVDTAIKKFGTGALLLDGTGDYLSISTDTDFDLGSTWTVDGWVYATSITGYRPFAHFEAGVAFYAAHSNNSNKISFYYWTGSIWSLINTTATVDLNTWTHLAFVNNSGSLKIYKNGIEIGSGSLTIVYPGATNYIGSDNGANYFQGSIDEFRVSKGIAIWTSNFTPPTSEYESGVIEDIDINIKAKIEEIYDMSIDIRAILEDHFKDLDLDIRARKTDFIDLDTDIRARFEYYFKDLDLDIRVQKKILEDLNIDIRVAEDILVDIDTGIRARHTAFIDIETDIRTAFRGFVDISTDIRVFNRISNNQIVIEESYFEEGQYLASQNVTIKLKVNGALKMQFKNEIGGTWTALETYADSKTWVLDPGDGDKRVFVRFTDIQNTLSDGGDAIEAVLDTSTPTAPTLEAYTDETATVPILASTYQTDLTPFFRWEVPIFAVPYSGFSYKLDGTPTNNIATPDIVRNGMVASKKAPASDMVFEASNGYYYFSADLKNFNLQEIILSDGHATLDRIDVIYVSSTSESLNVEEGVPSVSPVVSDIPEDGIELATVLVPATTTLSQDTTLTDVRQTYVELDKYLNEPLTLGQHVLNVVGACANGEISSLATFNIWIADDNPTIGEIKCYTDVSKITELANGLYQTADNTPYFEWTAAPAEPGPIRYYYTEDGIEPDAGDSFVTVNNYTPGVYADGITELKVRAYDVTTGYWGESKSFIFIYGTETFTNDTAVVSGNTILKQSLKEVQVQEIAWDFDSARICRFYQPLAFDANLPFSEGDIVSVVYGAGNTNIFTGKIRQIERTIDIGQEGVTYHCSGPRQDLNEDYAYIIDDNYGETSQISFDEESLTSAINTIIGKYPKTVKNIESYPTGASITDKYVGQVVSNVLDSIYAKTKYGWYMKPNGSLVSIDLTATSPGQAKFGIYGTTVNAVSPQYNVMASNLQFDITNRYNTCIIEGAKKQERVTLKARCGTPPRGGGDLVDDGDRVSDAKYKIFTMDTKWDVVSVIETFVSYARLKHTVVIPSALAVGYSKFTIVFLETEVCKNNKISRMTRAGKSITYPVYGEFALDNPFNIVTRRDSKGNPTGMGLPSMNSSTIVGYDAPVIVSDTEVQGSLGVNNTIRFSRAMYNFWPTGVSVNSSQFSTTPGVNIKYGVPNYYWKNPPVRRCASLKADVLVETVPLKVEVTVAGSASGVSKILRIVNTSFRYSEDPDNPVDDTARMTQYATDALQKYKDIKVNGTITLDTIDLTWDLDKTVNLINTDQASWSSLNAKVIGISYNFDANTTTLEITSEYLK